MTKIKVAELFCGIGGFTWGIKEALGEDNVELVFACEIDKYASTSFAHLHGVIPHGDITKIEGKDIPDHDILVGGFPCQTFSIAGKREGFEDKTKGTLFFDVARIIQEKQPSFFVLENVKGLISHDKGKTFDVIKETLWDLGYQLHFKVLNTKHYGLPQNRERIFILGSKEEIDFEFPKEQELHIRLKDILEETVDEKFFLSEEMHKRFIPKRKENQMVKAGHIDNPHKDKDIQAVFTGEGIAPCLTVSGADERKIIVEGNLEGTYKGTNRIFNTNGISPTLDTMQGGNRQPKILVEEFVVSAEGLDPSLTTKIRQQILVSDHAKEKILARLGDKEGIIYNYYNDRVYTDGEAIGTITTQSGSWTAKTGFVVIDEKPFRIRKLTPLECFRLQGFPDSAYHELKDIGISNTQLYKMSGNAVSTTVIKAIFTQLKKYI